MFIEEKIFLSCSLCSALNPPVTSRLLCTHIIVNGLFLEHNLKCGTNEGKLNDKVPNILTY